MPLTASVVTSKAANGGQGKTGQWMKPQDTVLSPCHPWFGQIRFYNGLA
jgi:hypothetical protein